MIGRTMMLLAEPFTRWSARRGTIAKRKRKRLAEYARAKDLSTASM